MKKVITALFTPEDQLTDSFGVIRIGIGLARMLLSRKLLMELAGSLYTEHFILEFTENTPKIETDIKETFQIFADVLVGGSKKWEEICEVPEPGTKLKVNFSVVRLTQHSFWWVVAVENKVGEEFKVRTAELPWELVTEIAGSDFDPKEAVSSGSFLVSWDEGVEE